MLISSKCKCQSSNELHLYTAEAKSFTSVYCVLHIGLYQCFPMTRIALKSVPSCGDLDPISYMVPWAHISLHLKWRLDWCSHFCTAHHRVSLYFTMGGHFPPPKNCPLSIGGSAHHTWFVGPTRVTTPNGIWIGLP